MEISGKMPLGLKVKGSMPDEDAIDYKSLVENSVDVICCSGFDRVVQYISPSCFDLLGFKPEELVGKGPEAYILAEDLPLLLPARVRILASEDQADVTTVRMKKKDGAILWVEINVRLVRDPVTGEPKEHIMVMRDITERKRAEEDALNFQFLAENSADIICRAGVDRVIRYISPSSFQLLGWKPEERIGGMVDDLILAEDYPVFAAAYARLLTPGARAVSASVRMRKKDGSVAWMEANAHLVRDPATGEPQEAVIVMRDVTERVRLEERLSALALTDGLTGLLNRRAFDEVLAWEWKRTVRYGSQISLLLLDLDHFKLFNDQYGHLEGDDCLRAVAVAVSGAVRDTDRVARYGGEEIAVILPSTLAAGAAAAAEKVRSAVEALQIIHEGNPKCGGRVTVSIGVATAFVRQSEIVERMPECLIHAADNAMYKAKREGRNRVVTALVIVPSAD
jgi:diguanylate cyclase (GGDEF)-like protein/PAS domain S-box-containing protein